MGHGTSPDLRGGKFTLYTDCKPIELILGNPESKPSARIERWNLRIQDFDFDTMYTKGHDNPSDFLSRHPCSETENTHEMPAEQYVNFLTTHAVPKAMTIQEIQEATKYGVPLRTKIRRIIFHSKSNVIAVEVDYFEFEVEYIKTEVENMNRSRKHESRSREEMRKLKSKGNGSSKQI